MNLEVLFQDKSIKTKAKVALIGESLIQKELTTEELIIFANQQKPVEMATCIEALEYATKKSPLVANERLFNYVAKSLTMDEPRVKWESARVIGNIVKLFPSKIVDVIPQLLINAMHTGTVVRWASAYALAEIFKLKTEHNNSLRATMEKLAAQEVDNGVKKKYTDALKKVKLT
ncbi:HEAT repeat domain-containing protein [Sphingobacterium psychroaquaticum]|uniref:Uncharacterized protein n=1 Tax=Sphingobacterium psychroaquaticum TaxID=561061 RepID=A0A1X7KQ87_9SPHI|nr:HEAT repeat domain-containing protein [Sphingobacterium psychroaquaticum]QBQ40538.1 hypothetical protein E2P86_04980 [Sphingobacterium psychroaquaticum]SMG43336.1 hypothetical protein SAMN05660862_3083 [Sphingobacterium psychroaquaticum]